MIEQILLERVYPGHTRHLEITVLHQQAVRIRQGTGTDPLASLPAIRLRRGTSIEQLFEQELVAALLARGYRASAGQGPDVDALIERLAPDVERVRASDRDELATAISQLGALPNVTITRGTPMTEAAAAETEAKLGVPFSASYRRFLTTVGAFNAVYQTEANRTELWVLGVPLAIARRDLDLTAAQSVLAARLAARHADFAKVDGERAEAAKAKQPKRLVPLLTTLRGEVSDEDKDGFSHRSERDCSDGQIFALDDIGRICNCGLRYAEVIAQGANEIWDDFDDVLITAAQRFASDVQRWGSEKGDDVESHGAG